MSRSKLHLACGVLGVVFTVFATWLICGWGGPSTVLAVSDLGSLTAAGVATVCSALTARSTQRRQRWAWIALTVGLFGWFVGDAIWAWYELVLASPTPFPSVSDAGYLLFPVGACLALVLLPIGGVGQSQMRLVLDGLIVAVSLFIIFWALGLDAVFHRGDESRFSFAVSLAYPISDLVLLTAAVLVLTRARTGQRAVVAVLTGAIGVMSLSDGAFVILSSDDEYTSGNLIDIGWMAGLLLFTCAGMIGARSGHTEFGLAQAPSRLGLWLPYVPLPFATVCMVSSGSSASLMVAALLLMFALLVRQFVVADENRRLLVTIADQAFRDPLTGLANRALFQDRLTHAVALQVRDARDVSVVSIDLDDFKLVNDSLGHPAGDALLKAVAERILECVRTGDTVARLGGDEFAVLIEGAHDPPLVAAHRISDAFDRPFVVDGHDVIMRPSVGLASGTVGRDVEESAETLLKHADLAMYAAKRSQHGGVHPFTADMTMIDVQEVDPPRDRSITARRPTAGGVQFFAQLRRAIDQGELSLVYQPKFTLTSGHVAGVEALVRWEHPERGLLLPDEFLPLARQNGLMWALTEAVVHRAACDAAGWRDQGVNMPFAVNLFPPSLGNLELPDRIVSILADGGITPECLTVEITEDFLLGNTRRAREVLEMLRDLRIRVAIDDFGSGYSALSYLRELPIDELKLDREFIAPILDDPRAEAIVCAVIDLTHTLGMTCVAEGVENAATAARLAKHGCDTIQGHYCGRPVPASGVLHVRPWLRRRAARGQTAARSLRWETSFVSRLREHAPETLTFDVDAIRSCFPALDNGTAFFDGPGGSQTPTAVADAIRDAMLRPLSNRGSNTTAERNADEIVVQCRRALSDLLGVESDEVIFGRSMTALTFDLSRTLSAQWRPGDEIVVTRLDHDANVRPWVIAADAAGAVVRWVDFDPETGELPVQNVEAQLSDRTRLVAVTAASNLIGTMPDVRTIAARTHAAGALLYVDGVHYTAHAAVDFGDLGADFFACSPYKFLGPHCGVVAGRRDILAELRPDKLLPATDRVPERFERGTLPYELMAGTTAAVDFLAGMTAATGTRRTRLVAAMAALEHHEDGLRRRIEDGLHQLPGLTVYSLAAQRTPTLLFTAAGRDGASISTVLAQHDVNAPAGSFYAYEASRQLGLGAAGGVRVGLAPYNTADDVDRLLGALAATLAEQD